MFFAGDFLSELQILAVDYTLEQVAQNWKEPELEAIIELIAGKKNDRDDLWQSIHR